MYDFEVLFLLGIFGNFFKRSRKDTIENIKDLLIQSMMSKERWYLKIYQHGEINSNALKHAGDAHFLVARDKILKALKETEESDVLIPFEKKMYKANCITELGFLYRIVNKFDDAEANFLQSIEILDSVDKKDSQDDSILLVYRETYFRLGELNHAKKNYPKAREYYGKSLEFDEKLGHNDSEGEDTTRRLLGSI